MNTVYLLMLKLRKKAWFHLMVMLELTLVLSLFMVLIGSLAYYAAPMQAFRNQGLENCFLYEHPSDPYMTENEPQFMQKLEDYVQKHLEIRSYGTIYESGGRILTDSLSEEQISKLAPVIGDGFACSVDIYDEAVARNLYLPLSKGMQLDEAKVERGVIPAVLRHEYRKFFELGETYDLQLSVRRRDAIEITSDKNGAVTGTTINGKPLSVRIQVCGFLNQDNYAYQMNNVGGVFPITYLFRKDAASDMILLRTPDTILGSQKLVTMMAPHVIETAEGQRDAVMRDISQIGRTKDFAEIKEDTKETFRKDVEGLLINFLMSIVIAIASIAGLNILLGISERRDFGVYYTCGCTWRKCVLLDFLKSCVILVIPIILSSIFVTFYAKAADGVLIRGYVYLLAIAIAAGIYMLSSFAYQWKMLKTKPADCIREAE